MTIRRGPLRRPPPWLRLPLRPRLPPRLPGLLSAVACAAVVLSGCGRQPSGPQPLGPQPSGARTGTGTAGPQTTGPTSPRQRAVADAARIVASFPRPPGAVRTGPTASLSQSGARPVTPDLASVTRWWRVPGRPQEVLAWIRAHLPPGFTPAGTGTSTSAGTGTGSGSWTSMFALPAVPGVLTQRELVVLAVRSGSQTAIRVDAQVVWLPARPVAERVPPTARVLTVTPVFGPNPDPRAERLDRAFTVTNPATMARIAAVVNGLTRFPDGAFSCPAESGGQMRLTFFTRPGGPVVARLAAQYGGCGIVSVSIRGRDMPGLSEYPRSGPPLQQQVLAIAGASWPVGPGTPLLLLPDLVTRAPAAGRRFVQDREPRPEQEFGVGVRRAVGLGDAVGEPQRRHALVGPVDLAEHVAGLASEPNDPGRPLACCGSAVSGHMFSMAGQAIPRQWQ
jgi:hypothetical protein